MLEAIELQISDFIIKPLDFDGITKVVNNASEKLFLKNTLLRKNTELELYLKTIEQMAFIIKMDMDLNITYINDIFSNSIDCETSNIIGQNFDFLKSKLSTSNSFDNLKESLLNNNIWEDTIKIEKDEYGSIYLKAKIIKIYNDSDKIYKSMFLLLIQLLIKKMKKKN